MSYPPTIDSLEPDLYAILSAQAREEGFPLTGAVDLELANPYLPAHVDRYDQWIAKGFAGNMEYLVRGRDRKANPSLLFPGAKSIFCVALPYSPAPLGSPSPSTGPRYARYLKGRDYHLEISERLERVMQKVQREWKSQNPTRTLEWKVCVDTSAVLERTWAALAGLGWIGKNTLLIHPQYGSYLFLAEVLLNQTTGRAPSPLPNYCGRCTRCLQSCPTQALTEKEGLNSNRCISYWTLEKKGDVSTEQKNKFGTWIAGCDICQEVCPFNLKITRRTLNAGSQLDGSELGAAGAMQWEPLLAETEEEYRQRVKSSALKRVKYGQWSRNLAIALAQAVHFVDPCQDWVSLIENRIKQENHPEALVEWKECLLRFQHVFHK